MIPEAKLSDAEVVDQLQRMIERLAEKGIGFCINESVPERLAYRYLLEELNDGISVMPGWVIDGCSGDCEECFQLSYCEIGKKLAEEYRFDVPPPPIPSRPVGHSVGSQASRSYERFPSIHPPIPADDCGCDEDSDEDIPF
jgi:hypothetical protein